MPGALVLTRRSWHALAEQVIAPLRVQATGNEIALQPRPGGFGTPELPGGGWVGVAGSEVVRVAADGTEHRAPISSLRAAGEHVGLQTAAMLSDEHLELDADAAASLGDLFAAAQDALTRLLEETAGPSAAPIHLWPEHFDLATELGDEAAGRRATYGISPGDEQHPEPYAYVGPWQTPSGPGWDATDFTGAERPFEAPDATLAFLLERHAALAP